MLDASVCVMWRRLACWRAVAFGDHGGMMWCQLVALVCGDVV